MKVFIFLFLLFLSGLTFAQYYDSKDDDDDDDDFDIPTNLDNILDEISKREVCFKNINCTQCLKDPSCVWTKRGTVHAISNNTSIEVKVGGICWQGGFMRANNTKFTIRNPSHYKIHYSTSKSRIHSLGCAGVSDAGWLSMMILFPIILTGALGAILMASLNVERVGFYEKI